MKIQITLVEKPEALLLKGKDDEGREFMKDFTESEEGDITLSENDLVIDTWNGKEHRVPLLPNQMECLKQLFGKAKSLFTSGFQNIELFYEYEGDPIDFGVRRQPLTN